MNAVTQPIDADLQTAFQQFNDLSEQFTSAYRNLESRFTQIKIELSDTKAKRLVELAEKEQLATRLHLLLTVLPMGVLVINKNGQILEFNHAAEELLATSLEGMTWNQVVEEVFPTSTQEDISSICINKRNLHISSKTIPNASDSLILINDVTDPIAHVDSVKRKERLAYLGNAIASVAHDIRTPLAASFLHLGNLDKSLKQQNISSQPIERIRYSLKNLENTLNNMLAYAKGNADTFELVDCKQFSETVITDLLDYFPNTSLSMKSADNLEHKYIRINPNAMITSMRNLIANAQQVSFYDVDVAIDISIKDENTLVIKIDDTGPGIEEELLEKIFEPFFTTKENGTGLGLSIVRSIIESHKGSIKAFNNEQGASFHIELPLVDQHYHFDFDNKNI